MYPVLSITTTQPFRKELGIFSILHCPGIKVTRIEKVHPLTYSVAQLCLTIFKDRRPNEVAYHLLIFKIFKGYDLENPI